jgi:ethanolamine utilization protein EutM
MDKNFALGMIEMIGTIGSIEAADVMAKTAEIEVVKQIQIGMAYITVLCIGDVGAVKAAVEAGALIASKVGTLKSSHVIARPHEDVVKVFLGL